MRINDSDAALLASQAISQHREWGYRKVVAHVRGQGFKITERHVRSLIRRNRNNVPR